MTETPDRRRADHEQPIERIEVPVLVHLCPHDRAAKLLGIGVVIGILNRRHTDGGILEICRSCLRYRLPGEPVMMSFDERTEYWT